MGCNGRCEPYRFIPGKDRLFYAKGAKRCSSCELFIDWEGQYCPCSGRKLRIKGVVKNKITNTRIG